MKSLIPIVSLMLFGCSSPHTWSSVKEMVRRDFPDVTHISSAELERRLDAGSEEPPVLLDVREAPEFAVSHLPGAVRVQPGVASSEFLDGLDRDTPIVAYCSVGYRSAQLAKMLEERGFTNVVNLEGSIFEWANRGMPVERDGEPVREVHPYDEEWGVLLDEELRAYEPKAP